MQRRAHTPEWISSCSIAIAGDGSSTRATTLRFDTAAIAATSEASDDASSFVGGVVAVAAGCGPRARRTEALMRPNVGACATKRKEHVTTGVRVCAVGERTCIYTRGSDGGAPARAQRSVLEGRRAACGSPHAPTPASPPRTHMASTTSRPRGTCACRRERRQDRRRCRWRHRQLGAVGMCMARSRRDGSVGLGRRRAPAAAEVRATRERPASERPSELPAQLARGRAAVRRTWSSEAGLCAWHYCSCRRRYGGPCRSCTPATRPTMALQ